jgi:heat shock protein HslJ
LVAAVLVLAAALPSCGDDDTTSTVASDTSGGAGGTAATADDLERGQWQLLEYAVNARGELDAASETRVATAEFDGEAVSGSTGCNQYSAGYDLFEDGSITIGSPQSTLRACDGQLHLHDAGGVPVLVFGPEVESSEG